MGGAAQDDVAEKAGPGFPFHFSKESLAALKAKVCLANSTQPFDKSWLSTNNAMSALVWRTVMAEQSPLETLEGDRVSTFKVPIERAATNERQNPTGQSVLLPGVRSALIGKMLGEQNISHPPVLIRQALLANQSLTGNVLALTNKLENVNHLVPIAALL